MHLVPLLHQPCQGAPHADDVIIRVGGEDEDALGVGLRALGAGVAVLGAGLAPRVPCMFKTAWFTIMLRGACSVLGMLDNQRVPGLPPGYPAWCSRGSMEGV
jgi:hypothetical protein